MAPGGDTAVGTISSIETIIDEARKGRPFILVDAEDRENEGDIVIPADFATPQIISLMAVHARGLICLAVTKERADFLGLRQMTNDNRTANQTAFTVSIEARIGVTTGISAADRARTIEVAIAQATAPSDLVTPGHVFPLVAKDGGVLVRAGHTEAAVDIARLAGCTPAGVICEIMNDDGTMARLPDLARFAERHGFVIGTIADLITFRRRTERHVEEVHSGPFRSRNGGDFQAYVFRNVLDGTEHVALTRGERQPGRPAMVRMHQVDISADILDHAEARRDYVRTAMRTIAEYDGYGVIVLVRDPSPSWLSDRMAGVTRGEARERALRDYGVGAQILKALGVHEMILLTSSAIKPAAVEGYGLRIIERRAFGT
jgi:3,4-dihydroxy 2-butanone 4-phosphate synthase/GTP cyclohydrolase II